MFIPFFNWYWQFRFALGMTDRLNFQFRLRGERPPVSRGLALTSAIVLLIPYVGLLSWLFLMPIVAGQWQAATNRLADEHQRQAWAGGSADYAAQALPPAGPQRRSLSHR